MNMLGAVLIFFGIGSLAFSQTSPFYVVVGIGLTTLGIYCICHKKEKPGNRKTGSNSYGGSDCVTTHTGSGAPEGAYLSDGRYESFSGTGWTRDIHGNAHNYITGVSVEKDIFGNYRFSDDDSYGNYYDSAEYGRYTMDYND